MLLTVAVFLIVLSILVLVHELGHYLVARAIGVGIEEFGLGLPPRAWGKKICGTVYSLNWLPIGGFVKLAGEDEEQSLAPKKQLFSARTKKERVAILIAGVAMNFLLAIGVTAYLLTQGVMEPAGRVHIEQVVPDSPASQAGLKEKDLVLELSSSSKLLKSPKLPKDLIDFVKETTGQQVILTVEREGKIVQVALIPRKVYPPGQGPMGVAISDLEKRVYPWSIAPVKALEVNLLRAKDMLVSLLQLIWRLITLQPVNADVAGPIGIAQVTGQAVKFGWKAVLEFISILSLNLAVLNILPIPALDGGRLAFVFLEKILGRRIRPAFEKQTHQIGMIILFALILLVSLNDILRLTRGG